MSKSSPVSLQELELESAELLPGRETLCVVNPQPGMGGQPGVVNFQPGYGNTAQAGGINVALLNGSLDGDNVNVLSALLFSPQTAAPSLL